MGERSLSAKVVVEAEGPEPAAPEPAAVSLEDFIPTAPVADAAPAPLPERAPAVPTLRSARLVAVDGQQARIAWRGHAEAVEAEIAPEVENALLVTALERGDRVLVEVGEGDKPMIAGILQTRLPREVHVEAEHIHLHAERELVLRAGRAALRLREDGDVELVGSRISAASRGLFRIVGRILRLN